MSDAGTRYPPPSHAATIWLAGDRIAVAFDTGAQGDPAVRGHTVFLTLDRCSIEHSEWGEPLARQRGWAALLAMLKAREAAGRAERPALQIGHDAAPTLYAIEQAMRGKITRYGATGRVAATTLADLGLED